MQKFRSTGSRLRLKLKAGKKESFLPYTQVNFKKINIIAQEFADFIEERKGNLLDVLLKYESFEVADDEIRRTLDLLRNLNENERYFRLRVGEITSFLPRNQPLYAFSCFVVVPSFMSSQIHFRIPHCMHLFFMEMMDLLEVNSFFPNIKISTKQRGDFLEERSAILSNVITKESKCLSDVVIFTGLSNHAEQLRCIFGKKTLFISNGSGHNPVIVSKDANIKKAVNAVMTLQFYNQGQDCAAPNSILVHKAIFNEFMTLLRQEVKALKVGSYKDKECRIGPISEPKDLSRIQDILINNQEWLDPSTQGVINAKKSLVEPAIIDKPLMHGGNYTEIFAPIVFVQRYEKDLELKKYFEDARYSPQAMYVTLYGSSAYIKNLINKKINGKIIHKRDTFLHNIHLHEPGVERGTKPYGGYGYGASSVSINGKVLPMPTLPQREIYTFLVKPILESRNLLRLRNDWINFSFIQKNNFKNRPTSSIADHQLIHNKNSTLYVDAQSLKIQNNRYYKYNENNLFYLRKKANTDFLNSLNQLELLELKALKNLINRRKALSPKDFSAELYKIPKSRGEKNKNQMRFFQKIYELLFDRKSGPRLTTFLYEVDEKQILKLLDI